MQISNLSVYKVVFTVEILAAMFLFSAKVKKRNMPWLRYTLSVLVCITISVFYPIFDEVSYTWWYTTLMFLFLFLLCSTTLFVILDTSWQNIFLIAVTAYTSQHLSYQMFTMLSYAFKLNTSLQSFYGRDNFDFAVTLVNSLKWVITLVIYALVYVGVFELFISDIKIGQKLTDFAVVPISALILTIDILANSIVVYNDDNGNLVVAYMICSYNVLSCVLILFLMFFILRNNSLRDELVIKSLLLEQSEEKYEQSKANVEMINIKVHDLKHQIRTFADKTSLNPKDIEDIEDMIQIYDSNMSTGNKSIDIILMEKKLICQKEGIDLKCFADCSSLGFVDEVDLYSMFGNSIDNAMDATRNLKDGSKKTINIIVKTINDFVSIRIENYYDGNVTIGNDGMPLTTKENKMNHGFGLKSIQNIVKKYDGFMMIDTKNGIFSISILFPRKPSDVNDTAE